MKEVTKAELKQLDALAPKKVVFTLFTEGSEAEVVAGGDEVNNLLGMKFSDYYYNCGVLSNDLLHRTYICHDWCATFRW